MSASIRAALIIAALSLIASAARSDGISWRNGVGADVFGGISGQKKIGGGGGSCAGAVDASAGCPLPMLGV